MKKSPEHNEYLKQLARKKGFKLIVEVEMSYDDMKAMMTRSLGYEPSDELMAMFFSVSDCRVLPTDPGSYSGIGHDINELIRESLERIKYAKKETGEEIS